MKFECNPGLSDGIFAYPLPQVLDFSKGVGMEIFGIFHGNLVVNLAWPFHIFCRDFFPILVHCSKKNLATLM
jgi:hypothetical protein